MDCFTVFVINWFDCLYYLHGGLFTVLYFSNGAMNAGMQEQLSNIFSNREEYKQLFIEYL